MFGGGDAAASPLFLRRAAVAGRGKDVQSFSKLRNSSKIEILEPAGPSGGGAEPIERRMARRLAALRAERGWTLEDLAGRTAMSRATLSRVERCELSPTATMLNTLCAQYGWTASRLMAEAESGPPTVIRAGEQITWKDPETGYVRRVVSPPHPNLRGELVEVRLPAGAVVSYEVSPVAGLEHHLWMLEGMLTLDVEGTRFRLGTGDCVRYALAGPSRFACGSRRGARYVVAMVRPGR